MRSIAFRMAFEVNLTGIPTQSLRFQRESTELVYLSDFKFLSLALLPTVFSALTVLLLMWRWWRLGRRVSLSPLEIARAFTAPELSAGSASDLAAKELMRDIGSKKIRYGEVENELMVPALRFAPPDVARAPRQGVLYF